MPYKKKRRFVPKKRKYKKRRYAKSMFSLSSSTPIGKSFKTMLRYVDKNVQLNPAVSGVPASYVYTMNGLTVPDITSGGTHNPLGYDQFSVMYDHYTVIGSRARVSFSNTDTQYQQLVILQLKDTATTSTLTNENLENGNNKWATLGIHGSGQAVKDLTIKCSPSRFFGRKVMQGDKYQGSLATNPSDQVYLHIQCGPLEAVDADIMDVTIEIEYIVVFTEPKILASS